ncbi:MAG: GH116 family glycosyl-hydrolase [Phycisphaerae bacterium]
MLKTYDQNHLARIALPIGGIGTGTVSLGGRGDLRDWEIVNRPAKGFVPVDGRWVGPFIALWTRDSKGHTCTRAIEGPIDEGDYEGAQGCSRPNHNLPRFRRCSFAAAYPFGQVLLSDPDVPLDVRIEAFNPLVPTDADASGIPVAVLRFALTNRTGRAVEASVCGTLPNFIGADGSPSPGKTWSGHDDIASQARDNRNEFRREGVLSGVFCYSAGLDKQAEQFGTMALSAMATAGVTHRTAWADLGWGDPLLDFWDDFSADGRIEDRRQGKTAVPKASLAVSVRVPARGSKAVTFLLTWHFPNRKVWHPKPPAADAGGTNAACCAGGKCGDPNHVGNYYATKYRDAWDVALQFAPELPGLEAQTLKFVRAFCESDLPLLVKDAALANLSPLRTQTSFRIADGHFMGWEGCNDRAGCCWGSCTHVWNYEQATAFLYGELAKSMRDAEFAHATDDSGLMSFRITLPLQRAADWKCAAADGQMGCIMKLYRDWQLSGDGEMLRRLWPKARNAMEFCWIAGGWDANRDGVMEGCQHNTMDVEYFGPNPQMQGWYLGALRAAEEMARAVGQEDFAETCRGLFTRGSRWMDEHLFNGQYYEHQVRPPRSEADIAPGLRIGMGATNLAEPELQLGAGCLVDQLVGQYMAHVCGLGYLVSPANVRKTLQSIMRLNFRKGFHGHFNNMRSYVLGDESALLMAAYPPGRRPARPFPYYNEVMTGFEYTAAAGMIYEGLVADGLKCIAAVRERYDGRKRSPFDEAECGHHYARAMASWAAVLAISGFQYSAVAGSMEFAAPRRRPARHFWSNGYAWGTCRLVPSRGRVKVELNVLYGRLELRRFSLAGLGGTEWPQARNIAAGRTLAFAVDEE